MRITIIIYSNYSNSYHDDTSYSQPMGDITIMVVFGPVNYCNLPYTVKGILSRYLRSDLIFLMVNNDRFLRNSCHIATTSVMSLIKLPRLFELRTHSCFTFWEVPRHSNVWVNPAASYKSKKFWLFVYFLFFL